MCGVFGWQWCRNKVPSRDQRVRLATVLGLLNDKRGGKSWGAVGLPQGKTDMNIARGVGNIVSKGSSMASWHGLFAHTRLPTRGAVTVENAHPFEFGRIVGAHNGAIWNWQELERKYPERAPFQVDSMHIFAHLAENKDLSELDGYGTIEWIHKDEPNKVLLCRLSSGADLCVAETEHGVVWSSDKDHLDSALEASELKCLSKYVVEEEQVYFVRDGAFFYVPDLKIKLQTMKSKGSYHHSSAGSTSAPLGSVEDSYWGMNGFVWPPRRRLVSNTVLEEVEKKKDDPECKCCGSPLDNGVCLMQYSMECDGWSATGIKDVDRKGKNGVRTAIDVLDEIIHESWVVNDGDTKSVDGIINEIKQLRTEVCFECAGNIPLAGAYCHRDESPAPNGGTTTSYSRCRGPTDHILGVYRTVTEQFPGCSTKLHLAGGVWTVRILFKDESPDEYVRTMERVRELATIWDQKVQKATAPAATAPEQAKTDAPSAAVVGAGPLDKGEHVAV